MDPLSANTQHLQRKPKASARLGIVLLCVLAFIVPQSKAALNVENSISATDALLDAAFYPDGSCLLTVEALVQTGKTVIDADVDDVGSRMLIHCDTQEGRRLTLLARGDVLEVAERVPLLTRDQIQVGEFGMIAWLTRSGVNYVDDSAPRRYVIAGNVILRKSPPVASTDLALHAQRRPFAQLSGVLEPVTKTLDPQIPQETVPLESSKEPNVGSSTSSDATTKSTRDTTKANDADPGPSPK